MVQAFRFYSVNIFILCTLTFIFFFPTTWAVAFCWNHKRRFRSVAPSTWHILVLCNAWKYNITVT